jgi:hypothetical protein
MDLRGYYRKIRTLEASLTEQHVVVCSQETPDGGKAGMFTEVPRETAAKLVVEGRARLATEEEAREERRRAKAAFESYQEARTAKTQFSLIPDTELRAIKAAIKDQRSK